MGGRAVKKPFHDKIQFVMIKFQHKLILNTGHCTVSIYSLSV